MDPGARVRIAWVAVLLMATPAGAAELEGRVVVGLPGLAPEDVGPTVVYLERSEVPAPDAPRAPATLRQHNAQFAPGFLAVTQGQPIEMPNDDTIFHNVFSFSTPNDFDLGLYPAGRTRSITFDHAGVVRLYCSIHESMNATVFVAPTPWFAIADASGAFRLADVPRGRFRLRTWSAKLPETDRPLDLGGGTTSVEIVLGGPSTP